MVFLSTTFLSTLVIQFLNDEDLENLLCTYICSMLALSQRNTVDQLVTWCRRVAVRQGI